MVKHILSFFLLTQLILSTSVNAQPAFRKPERLKVFVDCNQTWCDMTFIKTEINIVDFLLDRVAADVHILITSQNIGNGGERYQMIYYGQKRFAHYLDTVWFNTSPNATTAESRELMIKYFKIGLVPLIEKTGLVSGLSIGMKQNESDKKVSDSAVKKDPWNYWVFNISANGNISADKVYKSNQFNGNFSANRTTEDLKVNFSLFASENKTTYEYENDSTIEKFVARNSDYGIRHYLVKSINEHWSAGYEGIYSNNTFSNYKSQLFLKTAVEYDIFPYKEVSSKFFALSYGIIARFNNYYDTTIFNQVKETLYAHLFETNLSLTKKWGTIYAGISYSNFFHDWKLYNLGANLEVDIRITGGLSFYIYSNSAIVHDQVYIRKAGATEQEVLTRLRELETNFTFRTGFGINYRFGSKLNNFVNPRFEGGRSRE